MMETNPQSDSIWNRTGWVRTGWLLACVAGLLCSVACANAVAQSATADATRLRAGYAEMGDKLGSDIFREPLYLESNESGNRVSGDIYARMNHPFATVAGTFKRADNWCEVMILHLNTKYCRAAPGGNALAMGVGGKTPEAPEKASRLDFAFNVAASSASYLQAALNADKGPMGTSNYRIVLEAIPLEGGKTFLHFTYSYEVGTMGRFAMQTYLATAGRGKVGFTKQSDGKADYVGGSRGVVERNTMRYYLAIEAYLSSLKAPAPDQLDQRITAWYDATERYPRQLHEVERNAYVEMKRDEVRRQQSIDVSMLK
ncbi:MAG: hypothetical protein JWN73_399 [Betaproteobacteria bacterium]|nr:hypothetical protein [Betaproteobacteria bacterium]